MEKGKRPMSPGYEKRLVQQQQRRQQPELMLGGMRSNQNNQRPAVAPKNKPPQTLKIKRDHAYYLQRKLCPLDIPFSDARYNRYMAGIKQECDALQAKLDARDEADYWAIWGDVDAEDDEDDYE
ncbi:hypothetical protein DCAR_0728606 [Daucus carota subsp. sativus]|uniref:Uncharacterized protein n=1 Tax=Daucus carota subsp. sativus TaxID=79200 RepID=A0A164TQ47_DAUCS|nr:hypothetical protein DCAR_0728606 [Daucus carota subsp. sativus]